MTENKRFYLLNYNNHPIYDSLMDKEYNAQFKKQREKICDLLNEINNTNKNLKEKNQEITKLIIEYDTTNKYSEKDVINKIKNITGIDDKMTECKEYGLKCLKCPYWNHYSNYCTKYKIWSESQ